MKHIYRSILVVLVIGLVASACAGQSSEVTSAFSDIGAVIGDEGGVDALGAPETTAGGVTAEGEFAAPADKALGDGGTAPPLAQVDSGRDVIFTGDVVVAVTDVAAATTKATQTIQALGGTVFGQQTTGTPPQTYLIFKVAPADFQTALDRLGSLGELRNQNITADDVTERVVDLKSRIITAEASVVRLRELLVSAADINNIVAIETQLLERETQLETLRGQLRTIEQQVALATIYLTITEATTQPGIRVQVTAYPGHDDGVACPGSSGLGIDRDQDLTVCFEIINVGDTDLNAITLRDPILDLDLEDLINVLGTSEDLLEPGESIVMAAEITAERRLRTQTNVTAQPIDEEGAPIGRTVANTGSIELVVTDPVGIPGFLEGVEASWGVLVDLGRWIVLLAGSLLPFIWIPLLGWWLLRRRRQNRVEPASAATPPEESTRETEPVGAGPKT